MVSYGKNQNNTKKKTYYNNTFNSHMLQYINQFLIIIVNKNPIKILYLCGLLMSVITTLKLTS